MIVFIDEKYLRVLQDSIHLDNMRFIPINFEWMEKNTIMWNRLEREREIMNSQEYKSLLGELKLASKTPENYIPEYTLINHCKIDLVVHSMGLSTSAYFCWVDFGFFAPGRSSLFPARLLSLKKLNKERVNYTLINEIKETDKDIYYTLKHSPETIGGFFFFGPRNALKVYQQLYHEIHELFQLLNVVDDDQHLALRCFFENENLFQLHHTGVWHAALIHFQENF